MATMMHSIPTPIGGAAWFDRMVSSGRICSETVHVTPELAKYILANNEDNRSLKTSKIRQYVSDMAAGRWTLNGEPIIVATTGELNDGQHRLTALIEADQILPMLFVFGVSRESRTTVDQGAARSAGDYLAMGGTAHSKVLASLCRMLISYENATDGALGELGRVTSAQILERIDQDPATMRAAVYADTVKGYCKGIASPQMVGFSFYVLSKINETAAREYLDKVFVGENIARGDPAFAVRNALGGVGRSSRAEKIEMIFRGWNAYRKGQSRLMAKSVGSLPKLF